MECKGCEHRTETVDDGGCWSGGPICGRHDSPDMNGIGIYVAREDGRTAPEWCPFNQWGSRGYCPRCKELREYVFIEQLGQCAQCELKERGRLRSFDNTMEKLGKLIQIVNPDPKPLPEEKKVPQAEIVRSVGHPSKFKAGFDIGKLFEDYDDFSVMAVQVLVSLRLENQKVNRLKDLNALVLWDDKLLYPQLYCWEVVQDIDKTELTFGVSYGHLHESDVTRFLCKERAGEPTLVEGFSEWQGRIERILKNVKEDWDAKV